MSERLLAPKSVAIVGCSADATKHTARPLKYLKKHNFSGDIYPVNPNAEEIQGHRCYPSVSAIGKPVDHVLIMVPSALVPGVIDECAAAGIAAATIYTDGFAERGEEGRARQVALTEKARAGGVRLLGPNSMGYINFHAGCMLSPNMILEMDEFEAGDVSLISQSGSMIGALLSRGTSRGVRFSKLISIGNEADLSVGDMVNMLVDDPTTKTILLFVESLRNAADLAKAARRAADAGKPVIAFKLGRSELGREIAASHSGAMTGPAAASEAFFKSCGILEVSLFESLFETIPLVANRRPPNLDRQARVAIVSTTGAAAALVGDRLAMQGVDLVRPNEAVLARMAGHGIELADAPIMDLTMAGSRGTVYGDALDALINSTDADAVVAVVGSSGQFVPEIAVKPIANAAQSGTDVPVVSFIGPHATRSLELLQESGVPGFRTPESCAEALTAFLNWRSPRAMTDQPLTDPIACRDALTHSGKTQLSEVDAAVVFQSMGVTQPDTRVVTGLAAPDNVTYPVVAKVLSSDVLHKTEAGGVMLNISGDDELTAAIESIRSSVAAHHPEAKIDGVVVQTMETGLGEAIVGFVRDPEIGPMVMVGAGGVLAEVYRDTAYRSAPVDLATAKEMIEEVKGFAPLRGYRGMPTGDLGALAEVVARVSELALVTDVDVHEAEINPVLVKSIGVVALDGLINLNP